VRVKQPYHRTMKKHLLFALSFAVIGVVNSFSTILLTNDFSTYSSGNLVGQNGWTQVGATSTIPITISNGVVQMQQGTAQDASSSFTSTNSGSIYYYATINYSAKNGTGDFALSLISGGSFGSRLYAQSLNTGFALAWGGGPTAPTTFGAELNFNTAYNVVMRYDIVAGTLNDTGRLYVSTTPFDSNEASNIPYQDVTAWTGGTELTSFSGMSLRQGSNSGNFTIAQVNVATTFAEAIPEPTTWALIGLGTAFVLWRIRRRSIPG
jgi:hypothetical protein